jgi:uncharacterized protein (UPF0332 family)
VSEIAAVLWKRAQTSLQGAEALVAIDPDGAASRAYYAAFHAVNALFLVDGASFRSHKAVEAAVHRDLVLSGRWPKNLGADYGFLHRLRNTGDYGGQTAVGADSALRAIEAAHRILDAVHRARPDLFGGWKAI